MTCGVLRNRNILAFFNLVAIVSQLSLVGCDKFKSGISATYSPRNCSQNQKADKCANKKGVDTTNPSVVLTSTSNSVTNISLIPVTITFSEDVTGFIVEDLILTNAKALNFAGSGAKYTVNLRPLSDGPVTLNLEAGVAQDIAGNQTKAASQFSRLFDLSAPTVTFTSISPSSPNWSLTPSVTLSMSEAATVNLYSNISCSISISNATSLLGASGQSISVNAVERLSNTEIYAKASDLAGNSSECSKLVTYSNIIKFHDPNPSTGNGFGANGSVTELANGNIVITSIGADVNGVTNSGAVYLFNGTTGELISSLYGTSANDQVGSGGITVLTNGNFVVKSQLWDCQVGQGCTSPTADVGAITWGSKTLGVNGAVTDANSLIGSSVNDQIGTITVGAGITPLSNGNYVVASENWDCQVALGCSGSIVNVGAVTWASGTGGTIGLVTSLNSLVGSTASDIVGHWGVAALTNGNYVVRSPYWDCSVTQGCGGSIANVGASTFGSGTSGITGPITTSNSLVGSTFDDRIGIGVTALTNGNYVINSPMWSCTLAQGCSGTIPSVGAVTWASGTTGITGTIATSNSLVGSTAYDYVGGVTPLMNGNYVVISSNWDCKVSQGCGAAIVDVGAVTWASGTTGITGTVSTTNSIVGSTANDQLGFVNSGIGITPLTNGNFILRSNNWDCQIAQGCSGAIADVGAVTWISGTTGISGTVNTSNSLVGSTANDKVGSWAIALTNGNYVV